MRHVYKTFHIHLHPFTQAMARVASRSVDGDSVSYGAKYPSTFLVMIIVSFKMPKSKNLGVILDTAFFLQETSVFALQTSKRLERGPPTHC